MTETITDLAAVTLIAIAFVATALSAIAANRGESQTILRPITVDTKFSRQSEQQLPRNR